MLQPVIGFSSELSPESFNGFVFGRTQQLNELNELQRGIVMGLGHVVGYQMVQNLNGLTESRRFRASVSSYWLNSQRNRPVCELT